MAVDFSEFLETVAQAESTVDDRFVDRGLGTVGGIKTPPLAPFRSAGAPIQQQAGAAQPQAAQQVPQGISVPGGLGAGISGGTGGPGGSGIASNAPGPGFGVEDALGFALGFMSPLGAIAQISNAVVNQINNTPALSPTQNVLGFLGNAALSASVDLGAVDAAGIGGLGGGEGVGGGVGGATGGASGVGAGEGVGEAGDVSGVV